MAIIAKVFDCRGKGGGGFGRPAGYEVLTDDGVMHYVPERLALKLRAMRPGAPTAPLMPGDEYAFADEHGMAFAIVL